MYELMVEESFSAAHQLKGYEGECAELHGHNFKVQVFVKTEKLNELGLVIDFRCLRTKLKKILDKLDHKYLNELPIFKDQNPTSENLACFIYERLLQQLEGVPLAQVKVWESETACVIYTSNIPSGSESV
ncbi:TPA: 6-carboxytetrahydropterin synthase QueD [bacterium]|nr:6-carboxytetrahydropterin synthase QueD [bacterium]